MLLLSTLTGIVFSNLDALLIKRRRRTNSRSVFVGTFCAKTQISYYVIKDSLITLIVDVIVRLFSSVLHMFCLQSSVVVVVRT